MFQSGKPFFGYPAMGSWITYGLGSENQDLPGYIVLRDPAGYNTSGKAVWSKTTSCWPQEILIDLPLVEIPRSVLFAGSPPLSVATSTSAAILFLRLAREYGSCSRGTLKVVQ